MDFSTINWLGVLLGSVAGFVLGALWYGPLFGKAWMAALGITKEDAKNVNMAKLMGGSFVTYLVLGAIIAILLTKTATDGMCWQHAAKVGALVGLASTTTVFNNALYEMKPFKLMLINGVYALLNGAVIGAVIGAF
ncbi:MAG: DUF1761 domain-containing protein [Bacteroidia bacterium]